MPIQDNEGESYKRTLETLAASLGDEFEPLRRAGREVALDEAIEDAIGQSERPLSG